MSKVLWVLSHLAQWHNVFAFRTSRTSGTSRKRPGKHKHFRDDHDPLACWHISHTMAWCWHSRQTHGTGKPMMIHRTLTLETLHWHTQMMWSVYRMMDDGVYGRCRWCLFWVRGSRKPVHTQKLAQPHKLKINPNFEIWTILWIILIILCLSMIEHSADISVEPPCVTYGN